jgi:hypothetical protein
MTMFGNLWTNVTVQTHTPTSLKKEKKHFDFFCFFQVPKPISIPQSGVFSDVVFPC